MQFCKNLYSRAQNKLRSVDFTPLLLIWAVTVFYAFLCLYMGREAAGTSGYSTYTLQALAWREGRISLGQDYPWLELAVYQGDWYVSFPPVPSIPLYMLSFFVGNQTPDHLLVKMYVLIGCLSAYYLLRKSKYDQLSAACFALLCSFASCLLTLTMEGAVWYQAQTMAFMFTMLSLAFMIYDRPTLALFLYALSVGCRPFNAVFGLVLLAFYLQTAKDKHRTLNASILRALPGVLLGLCVAFAYGWYNYIRFGDIFEFGHNYLPEFSTQGGIQFSLGHVWKNIQNFVLRMPFSNGELNKFGFSFLLACPVFSLMLIWIAADLIRHRFTWVKAAIAAGMLAQLFLLLMHRTFGGYQFGARYTCDLLPYAAAYLSQPGRSRRMHVYEAMVLIAAFAFSVYGTLTTSL